MRDDGTHESPPNARSSVRSRPGTPERPSPVAPTNLPLPPPLDRFPLDYGPTVGVVYACLLTLETWRSIPEDVRPTAWMGLAGRYVLCCERPEAPPEGPEEPEG